MTSIVKVPSRDRLFRREAQLFVPAASRLHWPPCRHLAVSQSHPSSEMVATSFLSGQVRSQTLPPALPTRLRARDDEICVLRADTSNRRWKRCPPCDGDRRERPYLQGSLVRPPWSGLASSPLSRPTTGLQGDR